MKIILQIGLLTLCFNYCVAQQKFKLGISAGQTYNPSSVAAVNTVQEFTSYFPIDDEFAERRKIISRSNYNINYDSGLGYDFSLDMEYQLNNKIGIGSGFGISSLSTRRILDALSASTEIEVLDTVAFMSPNLTGGVSSCDTVTNQIFDIETEAGEKIRLNYLNIPLELKYQLIPDLINLNLGVRMQVPIASRITSENIFLSVIDESAHICEYTALERTDKSGLRINQLQYGLHFGLEYHLSDNLGIQVGMRKLMTNVFSDGDGSFGATINNPIVNNNQIVDDYKPFIGFIGVHFTFGEFVKIRNIKPEGI